MNEWSLNQVRETFLRFFEQKGHTVVDSSPLLPAEDPTLLFTNAGMNQFKSVFTGQETRSYSRACSAQKCVRAGGKHNDLENVGFTARHHTFFEMLGNFSFGDYFKKEAISYAWELLTTTFHIPADRLFVTVFETDDEAEEIWKNDIGIPVERIFRLGEKDNFWSMGETGPCGPCSEIHYDLGEDFPCEHPFTDGEPNWECGRFVEIWNLVFMQYNRAADGTMTPLPNPSIDTGMGLERITAVLNGKLSNYDIDIFTRLKETTVELLQHRPSPQLESSLNVIADHARAAAFLIADTITPSNEGRGYVLRRIMRRAIRHGHKLGFKEPFFYRVCDRVISLMKDHYPSLESQKEMILNITIEEEKRFRQTLEKGLELLDTGVEEALSKGQTTIHGDLVFKLYDTYGFPPDLTDTILRERGFSYNVAEYEQAMQRQRRRGKQSWSGSLEDKKQQIAMQLKEEGLEVPAFEGYEKTELEGSIVAMFNQHFDRIDSIAAGDSAFVIIDPMLFYATSGGQVGDKGFLEREDEQIAEVEDCTKAGEYQVAHITAFVDIVTGMAITQKLQEEVRNRIRCNHSATHLLHLCLHRIIGPHANQAGSLVTPEKLRFDFTHYAALTPEQIMALEECVNAEIQANYHVCTAIKKIDEAKQEGAMSLFGEKYGEVVRVVTMGDSKELCGGTHIKFTGQIGMFKIVKEEGIAAGVRRIEAITAMTAVAFMQEQEKQLKAIATELNCEQQLILPTISKLKSAEKKCRKEQEQLRQKIAASLADNFAPTAEINGIPLFAVETNEDKKSVLNTLDSLKSRNENGIFFVSGKEKGRAVIVLAVTGTAKKSIHAGTVLKNLLHSFEGKGGGRPDMAQGSAPSFDMDNGTKLLLEILSAEQG